MGVVQGWGLQMMRLRAWRHGAAFRVQTGMVLAANQTLAQWRHQMGSTARTWRQVEREASELIAVWTMCRLVEAAAPAAELTMLIRCPGCGMIKAHPEEVAS